MYQSAGEFKSGWKAIGIGGHEGLPLPPALLQRCLWHYDIFVETKQEAGPRIEACKLDGDQK